MSDDLTKIGFAIVGCGRIADRHAEQIGQIGKLLAVCDTDIQKSEAFGKKYGAKSYSSIDALLSEEKDVHVISVCSPNGLHAAHSIAALKAGKHVLCEKPMATSVKDCEAMIAEAGRAQKKLFIVKQNRFNPPVVALKKIIDEGRLGKIFSLQLNCFWNRGVDYYQSSDWKGTKKMDGGTLFTQFSHFIDLLYWINGDIKKVHSFQGNFAHQGLIEFEDTGVVALEFLNGSLGTIHYTVNSHQQNMEGSVTIFAEKGTVKIGGEYLNTLEYQSIENYAIKDLPKGNPENNYGQYKGSMSNHDKVYENIVDVLRNNGTIATDGMEGLKTVEIIDKIYNSAKSHEA